VEAPATIRCVVGTQRPTQIEVDYAVREGGTLLVPAINRALAILQARLEGVGTKRFAFIAMSALCIFVPPKIISLVERAVVVGYTTLVPQQPAAPRPGG